MIPIDETGNRVDWNAIRAEYIGGGTSYRKLVDKYGVTLFSLKNRAKKEKWPELRAQAEHEAAIKSTQKTAEAAADNAAIAAGIKKTLLLRLQQIAENFPGNATEIRRKEGVAFCIYRFKDLTDAYKDLTSDLPKTEDGVNELLQSLIDLERGMA